MKIAPTMPKSFYGIVEKKNIYVKTNPRKWTKEEIDWCIKLKGNGYNYSEIAESVKRSEISVSIKMKRLQKKDKTYNSNHLIEKVNLNNEFISTHSFKSICDVYAGDKSVYADYNVISNDKRKDTDTNYHLDALRFLSYLYYTKHKFDLIDLDPYGSAYDCFDLAMKMANKGIIITLGELGHKRFKRLDFVNRHYNINSMEDFTVENIISHIQAIGIRNKKKLNVWKIGKWKLISRVYFEIEQYKITEQWEKNIDK